MTTATANPITTATIPTHRYLAPGWFARRVVNPAIARLTRWGVSVKGTRIIEVRGRRSGAVRATVVNLLVLDGGRYLVAPRGVTDWVRNLRASGGAATLRLGRHAEVITATELDDAAKEPVLRAYLAAWEWEVGQFFPGLRSDSLAAELAAAAPGFPVFRLA